jgi:glycosyltransferase involved in cell wall biosynthesis
MNVLWICGSRVVGGAERATLQIAELLAARGHAIRVACPPQSRLWPLLADHRFAALPAPLGGAMNLRAFAAIGRLLGAAAPDIALATTADEWVWTCLARRRTPPTRLVLVRHMALPLSRRVVWLAARRADAVIAVSRAVRDSLCGRATIPPGRLHVVYNPVRFAPRHSVPTAEDRVRARQALGLSPHGRWVGFFGGLDPNKGIADVAHAVRAADAALGPTQLLLCGRAAADAAPSSDAVARHLDLAGRLHYLGETDRIEEALTAVDAVVMATHRRLSEALPATLIEAMACGTPVAAYATGGMREVIGTDGRAGRLASADDPADLARVLAEVLRDPAGATRMAHDALIRVRELFDPEQAADRYEQLFSDLTRRRSE